MTSNRPDAAEWRPVPDWGQKPCETRPRDALGPNLVSGVTRPHLVGWRLSWALSASKEASLFNRASSGGVPSRRPFLLRFQKRLY